MTIPTTTNDSMVIAVRKALTVASGPKHTMTKIIEKPGIPIMAGLTKGNPFPRTSCNRPCCPLKWMKNNCMTRCFRESITYQASCRRCRAAQRARGVPEAEIVDHAYEGESSRTLYTRVLQHISDYKAKIKEHVEPRRKALLDQEADPDPDKLSSFMWDHTVLAHGGIPSVNPQDEFQFRITGSFKDPLTREQEEAVRIIFMIEKGTIKGERGEGMAPAGVITNLNRKEEHFNPIKRSRF